MDIVSNINKTQKGPVKTKDEDFRTRRRRFYRLTTEEKPAFPVQAKNFYNHVLENKEIIKTLSLLSVCILDMKKVCWSIQKKVVQIGLLRIT